MNVTLLCPGPSLADIQNVTGDLIIGINRAVVAHRCDVWAAMDYSMIRDHSPKGQPLLLTRRETKVTAPERFLSVVYLDDIDGPAFLWQKKSMIGAMVFALRVGNAKHIDIYGFDAVGTKDFDGVEIGEDRSEKRWTDELELYHMVMGWLARHDCTVKRH